MNATKNNINIFNKLKFEENNLNNYKISDMIFFSSFVFFIPFLWIIIRFFLWPDYSIEMMKFAENQSYNLDQSIKNMYTISVSIFEFIFPLIGITYLFFRDRDFFISQKIWFLYFFFLLFPLLNIISSSFRNDIVNFIINSILVIFLLMIFLYKDLSFRKKIKLSFSKDKIKLMLTLLVLSLVSYFLINYIFSLVTKQITNINSFNQTILESKINSSFGKVDLFFSAVIIAPLLEELTFRKYIIDIEVLRFKSNTYSKIMIYIVSCFSFAMFHVIQGGDIQYMIAYSSLPLVTSSIYLLIRNEIPCITIHMLSNLISYIILLS